MRWLRATCVASLLLVVVACNGSETTSPDASERPPTSDVATQPPTPSVQPPRRTACVGIPAAKCEELVAEAVEAYGSGIEELEIRCAETISCTIRTGDTTVEALLSNGDRRSFTSSWHTAGDPEPLPIPSLSFQPTCTGVDRNHCSARILDALNRFPDEPAITGIEITCATVCNPDHGRVRTVVTFADATTDVQEIDYGPSG